MVLCGGVLGSVVKKWRTFKSFQNSKSHKKESQQQPSQPYLFVEEAKKRRSLHCVEATAFNASRLFQLKREREKYCISDDRILLLVHGKQTSNHHQ
jgi:hypothetical protein